MEFSTSLLSLLIFPSSLVYGIPYSGKIVNGTNAALGQYPYVVSYRFYNEHNCGGSIIGNKWILTAAHCVYPEMNNVASILFGSTSIENGIRPLLHVQNVKRSIRHPLYEEFGGYENDIGLVELENPLEFNEFVQPIALPPFLSETPAGSRATLVGWGYSKTEGQVMENLQTVEIFVASDEACVKAHAGLTNLKVHICAGIPGGGKGQCSGDSGGPLTVDGVQYGIVSWSDKPCTSSLGVFAKLSTYRNWIYNITGI